MIRFRLREMIAEKAFRDGKPVTMQEIADSTGLSRRVLSSLVNDRGYNTETQTLDKLCDYFQCRLEQIAEYVNVKATGVSDSTSKSEKLSRR